jgi:hypothetical protein
LSGGRANICQTTTPRSFPPRQPPPLPKIRALPELGMPVASIMVNTIAAHYQRQFREWHRENRRAARLNVLTGRRLPKAILAYKIYPVFRYVWGAYVQTFREDTPDYHSTGSRPHPQCSRRQGWPLSWSGSRRQPDQGSVHFAVCEGGPAGSSIVRASDGGCALDDDRHHSCFQP